MDLAHLGKEMEGLLVDADAELAAGGIGLRVGRAGQHRPAGRRENRAGLARQQGAGLALAGARRPRHLDETDRHIDRQNGKTLAGLCEGLHDSYIQRTVGVAPADHPAGAATVGAGDDQMATTTWPSWP